MQDEEGGSLECLFLRAYIFLLFILVGSFYVPIKSCKDFVLFTMIKIGRINVTFL